MAIIQTLRNKAGILLASVIGLALLAFILGEFLTSGSKTLNRSQTNVAVINGKSISINNFQKLLTEEEELAKMQMGVTALDAKTEQEIRTRTWEDMVQTIVLNREVERLGLAVSSDELYNLINGENPHPYISRFFSDPKTGILNRPALNQFLQSISGLEDGNTQKLFYFYLEDLIYKDRKKNKYNTLLGKGLYATKLESINRIEEVSTRADFSYVVKRFSEIPDSTINITDAEIKAYYRLHKNEYKQKKSRDIRYVVWEVVPSNKDNAAAEAWINEVKPELAGIEAKNTNQYIKANSDLPPSSKNYAKGELEPNLDEFAFTSELGEVYGPYFEDNYYKLAKLSQVKLIPDSVKASQITISVDQNSDITKIQKLGDSLKTELEKGADFEKLYSLYSADKENPTGNLGWFKEGNLPAPFSGINSISDSCFYAKTGDVKIVYTNNALHIIKITSQSNPVKKVQLGILAREVRISEETDQTYFAQASEFGAVNNTKAKFEKAIQDGKANAINYPNLDENLNSIPGLENSRQLVRWAYENEEGAVTKRVMQFSNKYVVAMLQEVRKDGFSPIEAIQDEIEAELSKEKKGKLLAAEIDEAKAGATDINTLANNLNLPVETATDIHFSMYSIPNIGSEQKLQSIAISLEEGVLSPVIEGNNGVYVIQVTRKVLPTERDYTYYTGQQGFLNRSYNSKATYNAMNILKELAEIEDNRINFY